MTDLLSRLVGDEVYSVQLVREVIATQEATGVSLHVEFGAGQIQLHSTMDALAGPEIAMILAEP